MSGGGDYRRTNSASVIFEVAGSVDGPTEPEREPIERAYSLRTDPRECLAGLGLAIGLPTPPLSRHPRHVAGNVSDPASPEYAGFVDTWAGGGSALMGERGLLTRSSGKNESAISVRPGRLRLELPDDPSDLIGAQDDGGRILGSGGDEQFAPPPGAVLGEPAHAAGAVAVPESGAVEDVQRRQLVVAVPTVS